MLTRNALEVLETNKPDFCKACPITHLTKGYVPPTFGDGRELWVGDKPDEHDTMEERPFSGGAGTWLNSLLRNAKINRNSLNLATTLGCCPPQNIHPLDRDWCFTDKQTARNAAYYCFEKHFKPILNKKKWSRIVAMGDIPLQQLTNRTSLTFWRGSPLPLKFQPDRGPLVIPTFHPDHIMANAHSFPTVVRDIQKSLTLPPEKYNLYPTLNDLKAFTDDTVSFDFEWDREQNVTLCGISGRYFECLVAPWVEPYISEIRRIIENAKQLIGHNMIGAELRYIDRWGWKLRDDVDLIDTMLLHHLADPDNRHGLAHVASVLTNKVFWKGHGEDKEDDDGNSIATGSQYKTWNHPEAIPSQFGGYGGCRSDDEAFRLYNARDTDSALQIAGPLLQSVKRYGLEDIYRFVSIPIAYLCRDMADSGLRLDNQRVIALRSDIDKQITELERDLPDGLAPYDEACTIQQPAPKGTYSPKTKKCKGTKKDGTAHPTVDIQFDSPSIIECPTCGKRLESGPMVERKTIRVPSTRRIVPWNSAQKVLDYAHSLGLTSPIKTSKQKEAADKKARKVWGRTNVEFTKVDHLKKLATARQSFAKPGYKYADRIYFNLLPHGTAEGRLSSSGRRSNVILYDQSGQPIREDGEIVTITDPNIQNQPKSIRKLFLADYPDWGILNLDIVQGENMLTAWIAQDFERLERLNTPGYDEHSELASRCFGKTVTKDNEWAFLRQIGKKINHARNYGMGPFKMQMELSMEGYNYSVADVREMIEEWKKLNARTAQWQDETIATAERQGYLCNAFGRKRWFAGKNFATKALAFLPASTLADCVLRMMIALHADRFAKECFALQLQQTCVLPTPWRMFNQVHDSIGLMGPHDNYIDVARMAKAVMEQPWKELNGYALRADVEYSPPGGSWGECKGIKL